MAPLTSWKVRSTRVSCAKVRFTHSFTVLPSAACTASEGREPTRPPAAMAGPPSSDLSGGREEGAARTTGPPDGLSTPWQAVVDELQADPCSACCLLLLLVLLLLVLVLVEDKGTEEEGRKNGVFERTNRQN